MKRNGSEFENIRLSSSPSHPLMWPMQMIILCFKRLNIYNSAQLWGCKCMCTYTYSTQKTCLEFLREHFKTFNIQNKEQFCGEINLHSYTVKGEIWKYNLHSLIHTNIGIFSRTSVPHQNLNLLKQIIPSLYKYLVHFQTIRKLYVLSY